MLTADRTSARRTIDNILGDFTRLTVVDTNLPQDQVQELTYYTRCIRVVCLYLWCLANGKRFSEKLLALAIYTHRCRITQLIINGLPKKIVRGITYDTVSASSLTANSVFNTASGKPRISEFGLTDALLIVKTLNSRSNDACLLKALGDGRPRIYSNHRSTWLDSSKFKAEESLENTQIWSIPFTTCRLNDVEELGFDLYRTRQELSDIIETYLVPNVIPYR